MIIAVASQKGGVGKTASAINVAACLAGRRVLLIDLDPQGGCALSLGIDADNLPRTIYDVLIGTAGLEEIIQPTPFGFSLAPANIDLAEAELALSTIPLRELVLDRALRPLHDQFDVVVIDTPPTLGLLTINAFAAADKVLIPVSTQLLSLRGLTTLLTTIERLKRYNVTEDLSVLGILPTRYDPRTVHAREVYEYLRSFGVEQHIHVFDPIVATVHFDDATNQQTPFVVLYPEHPASLAYREVVKEIVRVNEA